MMNTEALIEHLNAARSALQRGDSEQALSCVLELYESQHFTDELGVVLRRIESHDSGAFEALGELLESLHQRTLDSDSSPISLGMSISDFFADVPAPGEGSDDVMREGASPSSHDDFEMIEIVSPNDEEVLGGHFSFADLGGELSFENLDLSFSQDGESGESDPMLEEIWPEDSFVTEDPVGAAEDPVAIVEEPMALVLPEEDSLDEDAPAHASSDAHAFDGFFDELDEQGQWFSSTSSDTSSAARGNAHVLSLDSSSAMLEDEFAPALVEISQHDLAVSVDVGSISGVSETQDGLDVFDIFNASGRAPSIQVTDSEPSVDDEPPMLGGLDFPDEEPPIDEETPASDEPVPVMPTHHEPERSPELDFALDFGDSFADEEPPAPEPEVLAPEQPAAIMEDASQPSEESVEPPLSKEESDLFDDLFDFDLMDVSVQASDTSSPPKPSVPSTHVPEVRPSLGFDDLDFDDERPQPVSPARPGLSLKPLNSDPPTRQIDPPTRQIDPPTRQIDLDMFAAEQMDERVNGDNTQGGLPSSEGAGDRETRALPVVNRELVNPFDQDDGHFGQPSDDEWSFDQGPVGMPGLDDDWLDDAASASKSPEMDARDVHNDATAIPGLNASNSGLPFNPYNDPGVPRMPSRPPESTRAQANSSNAELKQTQERKPLTPKSMKETLENREVVDPSTPPAPSTVEFDYRMGFDAIDPVEESDSFDFDLGLNAPNIQEPSSASKPPLGAYDAESVSSTMFGIPFASAHEPDPPSHRHSMPTPLPSPSHSPKSVEKDISEDEFFALAESIAAEQSVATADKSGSGAKPYRGEPMMRGEPSRARIPTIPVPEVSAPIISPPHNPFRQQTPTGVREALVEESSQVSFALEEVEDDELDVGFVPLHLEEDQTQLQLDRARMAYERGDFEQALDMVTPLRAGPHEKEAVALVHDIECELERLQLERLGSLDCVPVLDIPMEKLSSFNIDHRAGFLLSQVDGFLTFEDIIDLSSMTRLETIIVLADLLEQNVIKPC